ncbi:hypothetical protein Mgra_00002329, partial [Meloidogyne graminicola]
MVLYYFKLIYLTTLLTLYISYFNVLTIKPLRSFVRLRAKSMPEIKIQNNNEEEQIFDNCLDKTKELENIEQIEECIFLLITFTSWEIPKELIPNLNNDLIEIQPKNYLKNKNELHLGGLLAKELWSGLLTKELWTNENFKEFITDKLKKGKEILSEIKTKIKKAFNENL